MTGWIVFTIALAVAGFTAIGIAAACSINTPIRRLEDEQERIRKRRLTLEAELELAYGDSYRDRNKDQA